MTEGGFGGLGGTGVWEAVFCEPPPPPHAARNRDSVRARAIGRANLCAVRAATTLHDRKTRNNRATGENFVSVTSFCGGLDAAALAGAGIETVKFAEPPFAKFADDGLNVQADGPAQESVAVPDMPGPATRLSWNVPTWPWLTVAVTEPPLAGAISNKGAATVAVNGIVCDPPFPLSVMVKNPLNGPPVAGVEDADGDLAGLSPAGGGPRSHWSQKTLWWLKYRRR